MTTTPPVSDRTDTRLVVTDVAAEVSRGWWVHLLVGIAWVFFAFVVLSFDFRTVWAVSVFFGVGFVVGGLTQLAVAAMTPAWRWLHVLFGLAAMVAGVVALVWPESTFLVMAAIVAWYILFSGIFDVLGGFAMRDEVDLWWLELLVGIAQVLVGFWAIGYAGRSIVLLVVWVGAAALARGVSQIFLALSLHRGGVELRRHFGAGQ